MKKWIMIILICMLCVGSAYALTLRLGNVTKTIDLPKMPSPPEKRMDAVSTVYTDQLSAMQLKINQLEEDKRSLNFDLQNTKALLQQAKDDIALTSLSQQGMISALQNDVKELREELCLVNKEYKFCEVVKP